MLTDRIQEKLIELSALPGVITVGLSKKIIGGTQTDTIGITFGVTVKETNPENILPTSVDIDGVTYVTDVIEVKNIEPVACTVPTAYSNVIEKYLHSGVSMIGMYIDSFADGIFYPIQGTLGFIAYHPENNILVGVTAGHLFRDISESSTSGKGASWVGYARAPMQSGSFDFNYPFLTYYPFYNGYEYKNGDFFRNYVGSSLYYKVLKVRNVTDPNRFNQIDAGLIGIDTSGNYGGTVVMTDRNNVPFELFPGYNSSWRSYQVKGIPEITSPMPFATTAELNALVSSPPSFVSSSGCGSGAKNGTECGLKIDGIGVTTSTTFSTMPGPIYFDNLISFSRITSGLPATLPGDSGAALLAKIGGIWKIIGMVIAGNETIGYACRIDLLVSQLGIQAWDGSVKPLVNSKNSSDQQTMSYLISPGINTEESIILNNNKYYQGGTITFKSIGYYV